MADVPGGLRQDFQGQSASHNARQHNGNINNINNYNYGFQRRRSDETLRETERNNVLLKAAAEGQTPRVRYLVTLGADVDYSDEQGFTALHHAALSGFEDTAEALIQIGADTNAQSLDFGTPLHLAAVKARENIVQVLLKSRANPNAESRLLGSPLHCAIFGGSLLVVSDLVSKAGSQPDALRVVLPAAFKSVRDDGGISGLAPDAEGTFELYDCTALHLAILNGNSDMLEHLRKVRVSLNSSLTCRRVETLQELDADSQNSELVSMTAVALALEKSRESAALWLVTRGAQASNAEFAALISMSSSADNAFRPLVGYQDVANATIDPTNRGRSIAYALIRRDFEESLGILLDLGATIDIQDSAGNTPLIFAVKNRKKRCVECLVERGASLTIQNHRGLSALMIAADKGSFKTIDLLLPKIDKMSIFGLKDKQGETALAKAAANGHRNVVERLLRHRALLKPTDRGEILASAVRAADNGHVKTLRLLLDDLRTPPTALSRHKSLIDAALKGGAECGRALMECVETCEGSTALDLYFRAAKEGDLSMLSTCARMGMDVDHLSPVEPATALILATQGNHLACVRFLCERKANVYYPDIDGNHPIDIAVGNGNVELTRVLVGNYHTFLRTTRSGMTALSIAASNGHAECLEVLLDANFDVNLRDNDGKTALFHAAECGYPGCIALLLGRGANPDSRTHDGHTALMLVADSCGLAEQPSGGRTAARRRQSLECVRLLLEAGADPSAVSENGDYPVLAAVRNGNLECVAMLLEVDAQAKLADRQGNTPVTWALKLGRPDISSELHPDPAGTATLSRSAKQRSLSDFRPELQRSPESAQTPQEPEPAEDVNQPVNSVKSIARKPVGVNRYPCVTSLEPVQDKKPLRSILKAAKKSPAQDNVNPRLKSFSPETNAAFEKLH